MKSFWRGFWEAISGQSHPRLWCLIQGFGIGFAVACLLTGCMSSESQAVRTLEGQGFTNIEIDGLAPLSCGNGDFFRTRFRAKGPTGKPVTGAVCCGWLKNCTVRTD